jgi:hypothetical protein
MKEIITIEINTGKSLETISALKEELKKQNKELENMSVGTDAYKKQEQAVASLKSQLNILTSETKKQTKELENQSKGQASLNRNLDVANMNLKEMQNELRTLRNIKFDGLKPEEIKMVKDQMANLTEGIRDFQEQIKTASESGIPGIVAGLQGIIATTQLVTGTLNLFGVENEKLEKSMVQLIGISQALATVEDVIAKRKIQVMAIQIKDMAIKTALAVKTGAVTAAQWAWNVAMTANPIGLIIVGIALLTAGIVALIKYFDEVTAFFRKMGEWLGIVAEQTEVVEKKTESYTEQLEKQIKAKEKQLDKGKQELNMMKARGSSIDEIKAKERELMNIEIDNAKLRIKLEVSKGVFSNERLKAIGEEMAKLKELKRELEIFDAEEITRKKEVNQKLAEENQKFRDKEKEENNKFINDLVERGKTEMQKLQEKHDEELAKLDELHKKGLVKTEAYAQMRLTIEKQLTDKQNAEKEKLIDESIKYETAKMELALKERYANGLITEQEYLQLSADLKLATMNQEIADLYGVEEKKEELRQLELQRDQFLADKKIEINKEKQTKEDELRAEQLEKIQAQVKQAEDIAKSSSEFLVGMLGESNQKQSEMAKQFLKQNLVLMVDHLEKQLLASLAEGAMKELASKGFPAGVITAGILTGLIKGAFAGIKAKIMSPPKAERGMLIGGRSHSQGGTIIEAERGEAIINKRSVAMFPQTLSAINQAGGGIPIMANGGMIGNVVSSNETLKAETQIEMNRMLINAISKMPAPIVMVEEMSTKLTENSYNKSIGII